MRTFLVIAISATLGSVLGIGISWLKFGTSTSALEFRPLSISPLSDRLTPIAEATDTEFNFGSVAQLSTVSHSFQIINRGPAPLTLSKGGTTCGKCTIAELSQDVIALGKSAEITVNYTAGTGADPFRQSASILTNDPNRPRIEFTVFGEVHAPLIVEPAQIVFSKLSAAETKSQVVRVLSEYDDSISIVRHEYTDPTTAQFFAVKIEPIPADSLPSTRAKSGCTIDVSVLPGLPLGPLRQTLVLKTNLPEHPEIRLPIQGAIAGDVSVVGAGWNAEQSVLQIGWVRSNEGATRTLLLLLRGPTRDDVEFKLGDVVPKFLRVTIGEKKAINQGAVTQVPVEIEIPPNSPAASFLGASPDQTAHITIHSNLPDAQHLRWTVRFAVED